MTCRHQCGISSYADGMRQGYRESEHLDRLFRARVTSHCHDSDCRRTCPSVRRSRRIAGRVLVMPWTSHHDRLRAILLWLLLLLASSGPDSTGWASAEEVPNRPDWIPLDRMGPGMFRSSEILQMYHIQATATLYEQGGLNHELSFTLTGVAFHSLDGGEGAKKVCLVYHPTNMTISLLPVISEDGSELRWKNQGASVSYVEELDQNYWSGTSYMGETTGVFFSHARDFTLNYHREHPRYQPFSVYQDYPGKAWLTANSSDEYVWELIAEAQKLGVQVEPVVMPQKHKIIIYSGTEPEKVVLDDGAGGGNGGVTVATNSTWSSEDPSDDDWRRMRKLALSSKLHGVAVRRGVPGMEASAWHGYGHPRGSRGLQVAGSSSGTGGSGGNSSSEEAATEGGEDETPPPSDADIFVNSDGESEGGDPGDGDDDGESVNGTESEVSSEAEEVAGVPSATPVNTNAPQQLDDWGQVVSYYQSLEVCLQERKFNFVASLKDFVQYFDCLDDVAFISVGPREYYKVNLTSGKLDHVSQAEALPEVPENGEGFTVVDITLVAWMVLILVCGVHGMLWQAEVVQHWIKSSGYQEMEDNPVEDEPEPPSLTRRITTEYLRYGQMFLGKSSALSPPPSPPAVPVSERSLVATADGMSSSPPMPPRSVRSPDPMFTIEDESEAPYRAGMPRRVRSNGTLSDGVAGHMEAGRVEGGDRGGGRRIADDDGGGEERRRSEGSKKNGRRVGIRVADMPSTDPARGANARGNEGSSGGRRHARGRQSSDAERPSRAREVFFPEPFRGNDVPREEESEAELNVPPQADVSVDRAGLLVAVRDDDDR